MDTIITIFCAFTRGWAVDTWLDNLAKVEHDPKLTNLCFIVDIDDPQIVTKLRSFAEQHSYRQCVTIMNENWHPNEVKLTIRRQRIAEVKNQSKEIIARTDGDIIIGLEDDTVFDRLKSFSQLYNPILENNLIGFVEGVQMGRWGAHMIGAWEANDSINPTEIKTLLPASGQQPITAGGLYGYATTKQLYLSHDYYYSTSEPWGPDVNYGLWLRRQGYICLIDWNIIFGHNDHNIIGYPDDPQFKLIEVTYFKDASNGQWQRRDRMPA